MEPLDHAEMRDPDMKEPNVWVKESILSSAGNGIIYCIEFPMQILFV